MDKTISVIIPVYNVEKYLPQCMESVLGQTYPHLQIILIDDGSTDGSGPLCDAYGRKDSRVHVIHQPNGGAAAAKNAGLRLATGEYLAFLDSDDYLDPDSYRHMVRLLEENNADAVQCSYRDVFVDGTEDVVMVAQRQTFSVTEYLRRYTTDWTCGLLWDKLYRRRLAEDVFFVEGHIIDDEFFTYRLMMNAATIVHDPEVVYNYRQRRSGVMRTPASANRIVMDKLSYLPLRRQVICSCFPELAVDFDLHYLNMLLYLSRDPYATEESLKHEKGLLRSYRKEPAGTRPPRELWPALLMLRLLPVKKLLKMRRTPEKQELQRYFE